MIDTILTQHARGSGAMVGADIMKARCRTQSGAKIELEVLDLSPIGCMVDRLAWSAQPDERVLIQLEGLEAQPARVAWVEEQLAGIEFEQLLHEAVLGRLKDALARPPQPVY